VLRRRRRRPRDELHRSHLVRGAEQDFFIQELEGVDRIGLREGGTEVQATGHCGPAATTPDASVMSIK
jgi:hypothetical protein